MVFATHIQELIGSSNSVDQYSFFSGRGWATKVKNNYRLRFTLKWISLLLLASLTNPNPNPLTNKDVFKCQLILRVLIVTKGR